MEDHVRANLINTGFKEKEIEKARAFISLISPLFKNYTNNGKVIDLCSGNGLASFMFLLNNSRSQSVMYDIKRTNKFARLERLFQDCELDYEFNQQDINEPISLDNRSRVIISIHPCSELADRVIHLGLKSNIPFAVMTCCHKQVEKSVSYQLKNPPDSRLMLYKRKSDYLDLVRQRFIEEQNWNCYRLNVPEEITPENNIILGIPKPI